MIRNWINQPADRPSIKINNTARSTFETPLAQTRKTSSSVSYFRGRRPWRTVLQKRMSAHTEKKPKKLCLWRSKQHTHTTLRVRQLPANTTARKHAHAPAKPSIATFQSWPVLLLRSFKTCFLNRATPFLPIAAFTSSNKVAPAGCFLRAVLLRR